MTNESLKKLQPYREEAKRILALPAIRRDIDPGGEGEGGTTTSITLSTTLLHDKQLPISSVTLCYSIVDCVYVYNT